MIVVCGSGRSGTSAIAHAATTRLGYCFGHVAKPNRACPQGPYECSGIRAATKAHADGGRPLKLSLHEYAAGRPEPWGVKYPELCDYLDLVVEVWPEADYVWADRHPRACARSRARLNRSRRESEWVRLFAARREKIEAVLGGRRHLRISMDNVVPPNEIAGLLESFVRAPRGKG